MSPLDFQIICAKKVKEMSPTEQRLYSPSQITRAGKILRNLANSSEEELSWAFDVLDNFRALHVEPLNVFQNTLRKRLNKLSIKHYIVAQRIKRKPTILEKLQRLSSMRLDQMDDIGGIRAIVSNMSDLEKLKRLYSGENRRLLHTLHREDDYISHPKSSGYRGIHLVFRYQTQNKTKEGYNGLRIELQIRTQLQHTWATAVETFEAFMGEKFKSSQGNQAWLDFFALVSSAFALKEKLPTLPEHAHLSQQQIADKIKQQADELQLALVMKGFSLAANNLIHKYRRSGGVALMIFDASAKSANVTIYHKDAYKLAYDAYLSEEKRSSQDSSRQVVLVKMDSFQKLERAYPNYFANLRVFQAELQNIFSWCSADTSR